MRKEAWLGFLLLFGFSSLAIAQGEENIDPWAKAWQGNFRPFIEGNYGIGVPKQIRFEGDFSNVGLAEGKLGYSEVEQYDKYVYSLDQRYLYGSYFSPDLNFFSDDTVGKVNTEATRFGVTSRLGFGYKIGFLNLLPYNGRSLVWTKITSTRPPTLSQTDVDILNRYEDSFRFGELSEAGVNITLSGILSLNAAYEFDVVYPRHLFWKWLGSIIIRDASTAAITVFSEDIVGRTSFLGPIIYFALKNGLSYAFYNAMKYNMNWPFTTEEPLTFEAFKAGVSITF